MHFLHAPFMAAALAVCVPAAHAATWKVAAGVDYTSGEYGGDDDITTLYMPVSIKYRGQHWGARITVPYLEVSGPGTVIGEGGQIVPGPDRTDSGLGDLILAATMYDVIAIPRQRFHLDLTAKAKLGTADEEKGLGSGENDYALQAEWSRDFERVGLFGIVGYKVYGDPPDSEFDDAAFVSTGGDYGFATGTRAGLIYDYRESALAAGEALRELTLFASFETGNGFSLQPYLLGGVSDSSPDWGAGVMVNWKSRSR